MKTIASLVISVFLLAGLAACQDGLPIFKRHQHYASAKPTVTRVTAADYVRNLARARLTEGNEEALHVINAYAVRKAKKPERLTLLIVDYKDRNDAMQQVAAVAQPAAMADMFSRLNESKPTLHGLRVVVARVAPDKALRISEDEDVDEALQEQQERLIGGAEKLPPLEDARVQLRLISFFIDRRLRDAAYLAVGNVKQSLAALAQDSQAEAARPLSQELEKLESDLRRAMPYTL